MKEATDIVSALNQGDGYWAGKILQPSELEEIQTADELQFMNRIRELAPHLESEFSGNGMAKYHLLCDHIDHSNAWTRVARCFRPEDVDIVQRSTLFKVLEKAFGSATITAEEVGPQPEIRWRLVRPHRPEDMAPIHADYWYWYLNDWVVPEGKRRIKVWTMIGGEAGLAGLKIYPSSHLLKNLPYSHEKRHGLIKPIFDKSNLDIPEILPRTPPGTSLIFDYHLLHAGALNKGKTCRISFEFTVYVPEQVK